jgi:pimeloyl-ACP methyl ester carboxylesterase
MAKLISEGMIPSGSAEIHYEEYGAGAPLFLLHGNGESTRCFDGQFDDFSKHFRVIAIDSRGHGKSTHGDGDLSLYQMAEDLRTVMVSLAIKKANILGFSDGGNVAMIFASKYPEMVDRLVLSGANAYPQGVKYGFYFRMMMARIPAAFKAMTSTEGYVKRELLLLMLKEPRLEKSDLNAITAPTLLTAGENDLIRPGHTEFLHRNIKNSALHIFPGGDHFVLHKSPEEYNRTVLEFLL